MQNNKKESNAAILKAQSQQKRSQNLKLRTL